MLGCRRKRVCREPAYSRLVADEHFAKVEVVRVPSSEYLLPVARPANRFLSPLESVQLRRGCQRPEGSEASREYLERATAPYTDGAAHTRIFVIVCSREKADAALYRSLSGCRASR